MVAVSMNAEGYGRPERDSRVSGIRGRRDPFPVPDDWNRSGRNEERQPCIFYGISGRRLERSRAGGERAREQVPDSLAAADAKPVNLSRTIVRCFRIKSCGFEFEGRGARADSSCRLPKNTLHNGCAPMRSLRLAVARFSRVSGSRKCVCASSPSRRIAQGILNAVTTRDCFPARSFPDGGLSASVRPRRDS